jgi:hypothetical protein
VDRESTPCQTTLVQVVAQTRSSYQTTAPVAQLLTNKPCLTVTSQSQALWATRLTTITFLETQGSMVTVPAVAVADQQRLHSSAYLAE